MLIKRLSVRRLRVVSCGCSNFWATICCEQVHVHGEPNAVFLAVALNCILLLILLLQ